jgi:hypothetical protein
MTDSIIRGKRPRPDGAPSRSPLRKEARSLRTDHDLVTVPGNGVRLCRRCLRRIQRIGNLPCPPPRKLYLR